VQENRALPGRMRNPYRQSRKNASVRRSAVSCPSPHSQVGVRTSGTPRPSLSPGSLYYPTRVGSSPSPACYYARGFLYCCQSLRSKCSRSASAVCPRVGCPIYLAARYVDDAP
ncbi:hypothetical protein MYCTH_50515, partial [Thermothelomyces thermophilus ATCC 42464]